MINLIETVTKRLKRAETENDTLRTVISRLDNIEASVREIREIKKVIDLLSSYRCEKSKLKSSLQEK
ncbi:hypothetical protein L9F63_009222, partial [Diploptera punctata]